MPRFNSIIFNLNCSRIKLFLQKNAKFSSAGGSAPKPPVSGSWGLHPQTPVGLRRLGAPLPDPQNSPPLRISGYARGCAFERRSPPEFGGKNAPILAKTFFCSSLNLLNRKKSWSRFIPPNVENQGKIANYPPNA